MSQFIDLYLEFIIVYYCNIQPVIKVLTIEDLSEDAWSAIKTEIAELSK